MNKASISYFKNGVEYRVTVYGQKQAIFNVIEGLEHDNVLLSNIFISDVENKDS